MTDRTALESTFRNHGFEDFRWLKAADVVVSHWVRLKCAYGCPTYGTKAACPPNVPSVEDCRALFGEYEDVAVFHFEATVENPEDRFDLCKAINDRLLLLEREVFLAGHHKAFLLFLDECRICRDCRSTRVECEHKREARPCPEALAVDLFATVARCGYALRVLRGYDEKMDRFAFLLVE